MAGYLYRAKRNAARASLYISVLVVGLLAAAIVRVLLLPAVAEAFDSGWSPQDFTKHEEVRLLRKLIRIDTTPETGDELAAARFLADVLESEGIPTEVIRLGERHANLIARLEGREHAPLILHNHLDTDPVPDPESWLYGPFSGRIEPPWIYGRGAFDMKSVAVAQLMALLDLKRAGIVPDRDVVFLATSKEETGSELGIRWLLQERPELFRDAWAVLTEGGVVEARSPDDIKYWGTEAGQKRFVRILACSPDRRRLEDLRADIIDRGEPFWRLRVHPDIARFLSVYGPSRDNPRHRELLADAAALPGDLERFRRLAPYQRSLFRDEISFFPIRESADGSGFELPVVIALLPDGDLEAAREALLPSWLTHGLRLVTLAEQGSSRLSDLDHPILGAIHAELEARYGAIRQGPYYQMRSGTDSRFLREQGVDSYGFSPFLVLTTDTFGIGGINESIALPGFLDGVDLYRAVVRRAVAP